MVGDGNLDGGISKMKLERKVGENTLEMVHVSDAAQMQEEFYLVTLYAMHRYNVALRRHATRRKEESVWAPR